VYIEEITFPQNPFFQKSFAPYNIKLHTYNVPSGVIEPVNEYSFTQGEDGIVTISHKVGANGIKNNIGAFNNAVAFVKSFTGLATFAPVFIPSGAGILLNLSENINRAEGTYSVTETYKYNTGSTANFVEWFTADITDDFTADYLTLETNLKIQGSPVNNNLSTIESNLNNFNIFNRLTGMGLSTGNLIRNAGSITRDSGAALIEIKNSYISGYTAADISGFFDYTISLEKDVVLPKETWKLEGEFFCKGPLSYQVQQLNLFKSNNSVNWRGYCTGLIYNSPIYATFHNPNVINANQNTIDIQEVVTLGKFKISFSTIEGYSPLGIGNPKYSVDVSPAKWIYDLLPAANIEGHYVVQDPQIMSQGQMEIEVTCDAQFPSAVLNTFSGYLGSLQNIYVANPNIIGENLNTGILNISYNRKFLGGDIVSTGLAAIKVIGSETASYTRQAGYEFGY
jgi:hypothetical protein